MFNKELNLCYFVFKTKGNRMQITKRKHRNMLYELYTINKEKI